jgi:hypothetical protein
MFLIPARVFDSRTLIESFGKSIASHIKARFLALAKADKACSLVFPTAGCKPKLDFLDCLKTVAE